MADSVDTPIGRVTAEHFRPGTIRHQLVVGPKFLYALFAPNDELHPVSRAFMSFLRDGDLPYRRLVVNEHIVDETATRLKKQSTVSNAVRFLTTIQESNLYHLEFVSETAFETASERFVDWTDLDASFTDFVVTAQMVELGIDHVATYDTHYDAFEITTIPYRD